jgi:hypothetical protein
MIKREEVYKALDSERDYQDVRWKENPGQPETRESLDRSIDEFSTYIMAYAQQLQNVCASTDDPTVKLDFVRKVGGLSVACMEAHGAPLREIPEGLQE